MKGNLRRRLTALESTTQVESEEPDWNDPLDFGRPRCGRGTEGMFKGRLMLNAFRQLELHPAARTKIQQEIDAGMPAFLSSLNHDRESWEDYRNRNGLLPGLSFDEFVRDSGLEKLLTLERNEKVKQQLERAAERVATEVFRDTRWHVPRSVENTPSGVILKITGGSAFIDSQEASHRSGQREPVTRPVGEWEAFCDGFVERCRELMGQPAAVERTRSTAAETHYQFTPAA